MPTRVSATTMMPQKAPLRRHTWGHHRNLTDLQLHLSATHMPTMTGTGKASLLQMYVANHRLPILQLLAMVPGAQRPGAGKYQVDGVQLGLAWSNETDEIRCGKGQNM